LLEDSLRPRLNEGTPFGLAGAAVNTSTLPIRAFPRQPASGVPWLSRGAQPGFAGKPPAAGPTRRRARGGREHDDPDNHPTLHRRRDAALRMASARTADRVAVTPHLTPPRGLARRLAAPHGYGWCALSGEEGGGGHDAAA
jgi:hypothetical protein